MIRSALIRTIGALVLGLALVAASPPAQAQTPQQKNEARTLAREGSTAYRLGRFEEALELYERAYKRFADPRLLYNLAQCHRQLGRHDKAIFLFRNFLENFPEAPNKAVVERAIAELEQKKAAEAQRRAEALEREQKQRELERRKAEKSEPKPSLLPVAPAPALQIGATTPEPPPPRRWYRRWYVWTPIALAVAGGAVTAAVLLTRGAQNPGTPATPSGNMSFFGAR